jgi:hypothetical protein
MLDALDALEAKRLIANDLVREGELLSDGVCAIGAIGMARGIEMSEIDPEDRDTIAGTFDVAPALAAEIMYENDEGSWQETPEQRFARMRAWVDKQIRR